MAGTVIVRIEPIKTMGNLTHDLDNSRRPDYVDSSKSKLNTIVMGKGFKASKSLFKQNKESIIDDFNTEKQRQRDLIIEPDDDSNEEDKQVYLKARRRIRNWQSHMNTHLSGFIGFGHDAQANGLSHEKMDECARDYVEKLCERHNIELLYLVRHMDETTVHYHFLTTNYNFNTHQTLRLTRNDLRKEQDHIGEAFSCMNLTRGLDKQTRLKKLSQELNQPMKDGKYSADVWKESNVIHRSVKQLHEDLPLEIEAKQQEIEEIQTEINAQQQKLEKNEKLIAKNEHKLTMLDIQKAGALVEQEKIEKRLTKYKKRVNDAQAEINRLSLDFKRLEGTVIEYVSGHEKQLIGQPKPILKKARVVSEKKANEHFKVVQAKALNLEQEELRIQEQRKQIQNEQWQAENEIKAFFAKQEYKHMVVFGKPVESSEEALDFITWFEQKTGWVTTNIGTRFKVQEENGQVVRVVVENTEGKTNYQKAHTLLFATHKSKLDKGYFNGPNEVFIEFYKLITKESEKYDFELILTQEQEALLVDKGLVNTYDIETLNELSL